MHIALLTVLMAGSSLITGPAHSFQLGLQDLNTVLNAYLAPLWGLLAGIDPHAVPESRLTAGEACYAVELNGQVMGATRPVVWEVSHEGRPTWRIDVHQRLPAMQFDVRDTFIVDRGDLSAIHYGSDRAASDRAPAQRIRLSYDRDRLEGSRAVAETLTPIEAPLGDPVLDGNLGGLTFSGLDRYDGARHTLSLWHHDKGFGEFTVAVVGDRLVETPDGPLDAWVLEAGDGSGRTTAYLIAKTAHAELGYSAGPFAQRLGGDRSGFLALDGGRP